MSRLLVIGLIAAPLLAQSAQPATPVFSVGQPPRWLPYAEGFGIVGSPPGGAFGGLVGVDRPILNPVTGLLTASGEAYGTWHGGGDGGLRLIANAPALGVGVGAN